MLTKENTNASGHNLSAIVFITITVVSMGLMAFQVILTRLLSIMLSYHHVYGVTSIAMIGSGIGGFAVHYLGERKKTFNTNYIFDNIVVQLSLISMSMIASMLIAIQISKITIEFFLLFAMFFSAPFFFGGMLLSSLFKRFPLASGKLYFFDLTGAALGCVLVFFSLNNLGDIKSIFLFSILISIISIVFVLLGKVEKSRFIPLIVMLIIGALLLNNVIGGWIQVPIGRSDEKEIYDSLHIFNGKIEETVHSAFGRTDLVQYEDIHEHMDIYLDGTAGTPMYKFNGNIDNPNEEVLGLKEFPGYFPIEQLNDSEKDSALIIGPGGGRDVILALLGGVKEITAIEVNPDLVNLVNKYSSYNGGIYSDFKNINVVVDEGRSFLRSNVTDKFDLIMLTLPRTNTSRSAEGYALTENYLFTTDSISEYLNGINENGHLIVVANDDVEILRLLTLTLTVFENRGINIKEAMDYVYILGSSPNPVFVLRNGVFDKGDIDRIFDDSINKYGHNPSTSFFPKLENEKRNVNPLFLMIEDGQVDIETLTNMVKDMGYDVRPVSDNNPFFYKLTYGVPKTISSVFIFTLIFMASMTSVFLSLGNDSKKKKKGFPAIKTYSVLEKIKFIVIFSLLGIGYMLIEISLIQKFVFFLGKPVSALTVILFTVLVGSGIGSFIAHTIRNKKRNTVKLISISTVLIIIILLLCNFIIVPTMFKYFLQFNFSSRMILSVVTLLPLSMVMGMPFPLTISVLHEQGYDDMIPWMWAINSIGSVLGSVLAITIAISLGYNQAIILAAISYLLINLSLRKIKPVNNN
ncbi:MAG: hypothetical protein RBT15_04145 [Gudongella sp.]|jgi:hypothetical protein|nr:hypothetical protein [Gudongella sp.]